MGKFNHKVENMNFALQKIKLNNNKKIVWEHNPKKLTCIIVEPRNHPNLEGCLYNMANIYANTDVGLTIYHSKKNKTLVENITKTWIGVKLFCLEVDNLTIKDYSNLLTTSEFYEPVLSTHLLIFQTDSCIVKAISDEYFEYDYVGARWKHRKIGNGCGNGGFSLRKKSAIIKAIINTKHQRHPEDVFFAHAKELKLPYESLQKAFSVETVDHPDPIGCHKLLNDRLYMKLVPYAVLTINFGSNKKNVKHVKLEFNLEKYYKIILKPTKYPDKFKFKIKNKLLTIERIDKQIGWGHEHTCHIFK